MRRARPPNEVGLLNQASLSLDLRSLRLSLLDSHARTIDCDSAKHNAYLVYAWAMIVHPFGPLGTPAIYGALVYWVHGSKTRRMRANEILQESLREEALAAILVERLESRERAVAVRLATKTRNKPRVPPLTPPVRVPTDADLPPEVKKRIEEIRKEQEALLEMLPDYVKKLLAGYKLRNAGFEIFECFRKLALVCMPVMFEPGSVPQLLFGLIVCFTTFGLYTKIAPYEEARANVLAQVCQVQIFFALLSAIALKYNADSTDQSVRNMDVMLTVLTCIPLSLTVLLRTPLAKLLDRNERNKFERTLKRLCCTRQAHSVALSPAFTLPTDSPSSALFAPSARCGDRAAGNDADVGRRLRTRRSLRRGPS